MAQFAPGGGQVATGSVSVTGLTLSGNSNSQLTTGLSGVETSIAFASDTKWFRVRAQGNAKLQLAYTATESGTNYYTLAPGNVYEPPAILSLSGTLTLYLQSNKDSTLVEVETWS